MIDVQAPILQIDHLTMRFGGLVAIDDLSFEVRRSEITALIGPNGAGKTTVFNCITGFYKPTTGLIAFYKANNGTVPPASPTMRSPNARAASILSASAATRCSSSNAWPTTISPRAQASPVPSRISVCSVA